MDEQHLPTTTQATPAPAFGRRDLGLLLLLILLATGMRWWQLTHTEVAARDSIGYIRIAWQLRHEVKELRDPAKLGGDWAQVVRTAPQHPGYPAALLLVSMPVRRFYSGELPELMQFSAQLTSALAGVLLVVPMFLLGRSLFHRRAGFVAALLFQCLPSSGRLMADGLSEPFFLFLVSIAILFAHYGLRKGSPWWFAGVGLFGGLAYLTRPEGALVVAAVGLVLVGLQAFAGWRRPWANLAQSGVLLTWGALTVAGPFVLIVGHLTTKHTANEVMSSATAQVSAKLWGGEDQQEPQVMSDAMAGNPAAEDPKPLDTAGALRLFGLTLAKSFFYVGWVPLLFGLALGHSRFRLAPVTWVLLLVPAALGFLLYRVPVVMGYLSDRHTVLILFCATFWMAAGVTGVGDFLADWCAARSAAWGRSGGMWGRRPFWALALVAPLIAVALIKTLEPLHTDRLPFREAGHWLAQNAGPGADIDDPYCWASYYAGRLLTPDNPAPAAHSGVCYVVIEKWEGDRRMRKKPITDPKKWRDLKPVQAWPVQRGKEQSQVMVYAVNE